MPSWLLIGGGILAVLAAALPIMLLAKVKQARRASKHTGCYYCGSPAERLAAPSGLVDWLLENWDCFPHRCEICFQRYYRYRKPQIR